MTIGEKIKAVRKKRGLTQKQLADLSGLLESTIRKYEYGRFQPKKETVHKIAKALGVHFLILIMDEKDYWEIQYWLTHKLSEKENDPTYTGKRFEGYEEAILAVKSKLHELYTIGDNEK